MLHPSVRARIEAASGARVVADDLPRAGLADGRRLFVKADSGAPAGMFTSEAEGLRLLRNAKALRVPEVIAVGEADRGPAFIALELLEGAQPSRRHDEELGEGLAQIHRVTRGAFGLEAANFIATLSQDNRAARDWPAFYRERRLEPLVRKGVDRRLISMRTCERFDVLFSRIDSLAQTMGPPSLLHGDLWSGNAVTDERGAPCLIDPSTYFGNREVDLAMMRLFGGFGDAAFDAYARAHPLEPGHAARIPLYQLYPVLVHVHLFGGSYVPQLDATLEAALRGS